MITAAQCLARYGDPHEQRGLVLWRVPWDLCPGVIPDRVYCHRELTGPLTNAFQNLVTRGLAEELMSWDGCFNIRTTRGGTSRSLHSWGVAVDVNAATNPFGGQPTLSPEFVACFTDAGFDWGGVWRKPDGMHFQLREFPP